MVKINITVEGEDLSEIISEFLNIGISVFKSNRKELQEILKILADDTIDVLLERKTLEKGALLYRKINSEINWSYKHKK